MRKIVLNNGIEIPMVGIGTNTFGKVDNQYYNEINFDTKELRIAIDVGYRLIDTAISYRNEAVIGKALKESNIDRTEFFVTTKIPGGKGYLSKEEVHNAVTKSLEALNTDYIDIMLIHHPWENLDEILSVYRELELFVDQGKIKTLGVSNFNEKQLGFLMTRARIKPAINQILSCPGKWQHEFIKFNQDLGVVVEAWSPLNKVTDEQKEVLNKIGKKYNKTWAQVILNYQVNRNVIVLPKSHRKEGQMENIDIFDFQLTVKESEVISKL